jgi:hypothetical protein
MGKKQQLNSSKCVGNIKTKVSGTEIPKRRFRLATTFFYHQRIKTMTLTKIKTVRAFYTQYCKNASNEQLPNIYRDEVSRAERHGEDSDIGANAVIFAEEAKAELERRNLWKS